MYTGIQAYIPTDMHVYICVHICIHMYLHAYTLCFLVYASWDLYSLKFTGAQFAVGFENILRASISTQTQLQACCE